MLRVKSKNVIVLLSFGSSGFHSSLLLFFQPFNFLKMKKEKKVWALTLVAFWWLSPNLLQAQQDSVSSKTLDEIVITGTRVEQPIIEVPRSVSVISSDVIQRSVFNSVGELLSAEAGIYLVGSGQTPGTNQSIFLRGANSNQTVILINGLRITDPSSPNSSIDLSEISLTDIERIEIIRGSHSTLYGGSAIGGAINIITKKSVNDGFHGNAYAQGGTLGQGSASFNGSVNLNYRTASGFYFHTGIFEQRVKGFNATEDTIHTAGVFKTTDGDDFIKTDYYARAGYLTDKWDISVSAKKTDQHAEIDDRAYDDDDNAYLDFERKLLEYRAGYKLNDRLTLVANGSISPSTRYSKNDSSIVNDDGDYDRTYIEATYNGRTVSNELFLNYTSGKIKGLFGGGEYREKMNFQTFYFSNAFGFPFESEVNYDSIDTSSTTKYVFAQAGFDIKKFNLKAGARLSDHSRFGKSWTFEVNPSYKIQNTLIYGSVSTGYNAPSLYQLFDPSGGFGTSVTRGNSRLQAEESVSAELGIKKEYNSGSYFAIATFSSVVKNNIEYVYVWNKNTAVEDLTFLDYVNDTYLNLSKQEVSGIEISGYVPLRKFYLRGNVSRIAAKVTINPDDISNDETEGHHVQLYNYGSFVTKEVTVNSLVRRPAFTSYVEAGYKPTANIALTLSWRNAGSRNDVEYDADLGPYGALAQAKVKRYNLVDAGVNYQINKTFGLSGKVENLLGENYTEIYGFQTRGRSAYIKLQAKW
jgi:vitamin B12 transporter